MTFPFLGIISVNGGSRSIEKTVEYLNAFLSQSVYSTFLETEIYLKSSPSLIT